MANLLNVIIGAFTILFAGVAFFSLALTAAVLAVILNPMIWAVVMIGTVTYLLLAA